MKAEFNFRALLLKIQDFLSEDDRKRLHFLLGDAVPRRLRDDTSVGGALRVLDSLIEQAHISEKDCDYLIEAFSNIQCYNVSQRLQAYREAHKQPWNERSLSLEDVLRDIEEDKIALIAPEPSEPDSVVDVFPCPPPVDSTTSKQSPSDTADPIRKPLDTSSYPSRIRKGSWSSTRKIVLPIIIVLILLAFVPITLYSLKSSNCDAEMYKGRGEYSKALRCYEQLLKIQNETLSPNYPAIATSYSNIGEMYYHMGAYSEALDYHKRSLRFRQESESVDDADLATSYNNVGLTYDKMGNYSLALQFYKDSLQIREKSDPNLVTSYDNVCSMYEKMGNYSQAVQCYKESLRFLLKSEPVNNTNLAISYSKIGFMYDKLENYSQALYYYDRSLRSWEHSPSARHAVLTNLRNRIAVLCETIGDESKAYDSCETTRQDWEQTATRLRVRRANGK